MLSLYAAAYFYGDHPYGRPASGDETTVARLTREDVRAFYRSRYGGDRWSSRRWGISMPARWKRS